ncbi:MAG: 1-acyl-sn-glycerol-3-phosphate acyltransferase [Paludibacteraceae bacterium]|nr:1-acyl-sn-glycerol-3-phosphate acyltransferase [Paludibacteraceae bacterium]MBQ9705445.1 1-acyl-sn-glycerol-3-phosphate acyltransferase [Paludibacteraceae bacterium]
MTNKRYDTLQVEQGIYVPQVGRDCPQEHPDRSILHPKYIRHDVFDETYPYLDDSFRFRFNNWVGYNFVLRMIVYTINRVKNGLRVRGRENLKAYRQQLKGGAITICNHCNRLDAPAVLCAVRAKRTTRIPMYAPNFNTKDRWYMWAVGGIPIPESGMQAMKLFNAAFDEFHRRGAWFHIFPEAARWDAYKPLRPFQKGAFTMAYKYDMPLIPCVITFRPRTGIYRLFGKPEEPLLTVTVGTPVLPDRTNSRKDEVNRLRLLCHSTMQQMAGITSNTWPAVPENE